MLATIAASGIDPTALCFEITENVIAAAFGSVVEFITAMRPSGTQFSLDDFGTGTSSLALLKRLDIDYLKIDGGFVKDCDTNATDAAIVESVHRLAQVMNLKTVAEYACSPAVVARLREIGVDYGQGWAYSTARPIAELFEQQSNNAHASGI